MSKKRFVTAPSQVDEVEVEIVETEEPSFSTIDGLKLELEALAVDPQDDRRQYATYFIWMTLDMVKGLLKLGGNFRLSRSSKVAQYTSVMRAGDRWYHEMEPIYVDVKMGLIQGQHRLQAYLNYLLAGGEVAQMEVRVECPAEYSLVMDACLPRTNAQRAHHLGHKNSSLLSTLTLAAWQIASTGLIGHTPSDPDLVREVLGTSEDPTEAALWLGDGGRLIESLRKIEKNPGITVPTLGVGAALMLRDDEIKARQFLDELLRYTKLGREEGLENYVGLSSTGPGALASFLRGPHRFALDVSRHERKTRALSALWLVWVDPKYTLSKLNVVFGTKAAKGDQVCPAEKTDRQWRSVGPGVAVLTKELLGL